MNTQGFFSQPNFKMEHLWTQRNHLSFVWEYHLWMVNHTTDRAIKESHRAVADRISEALAQLDVLIKTLAPRPVVGPDVQPLLPLKAKMDE